MNTLEQTPSSNSRPKTRPQRPEALREDVRDRSSPESGAAPPGVDSDSADLVGLYLDLFGRPPLGDHPRLDGYTTGRVLAEKYPEEMQRVMSGIRSGIKEGTEAAEAAGGQESC